jgi:hypothetical protein
MESKFGGAIFLPLLDFFFGGPPLISLLFCIPATNKKLEVLMSYKNIIFLPSPIDGPGRSDKI